MHCSCIIHEVVKYIGCNYYVTFICILNLHLSSESVLGFCSSSCSTNESLEMYHRCNDHVGSIGLQMITENSDFCWCLPEQQFIKPGQQDSICTCANSGEVRRGLSGQGDARWYCTVQNDSVSEQVVSSGASLKPVVIQVVNSSLQLLWYVDCIVIKFLQINTLSVMVCAALLHLSCLKCEMRSGCVTSEVVAAA